jgi:hypothetical protein
MKNVVIILLTLLVGALILQTFTLRHQTQEMTAKLNALSKSSSLNLQAECAKQARQQFYDRQEGGEFTSHYNAKMNKCFIQVNDTNPGQGMLSYDVYDAFEGKDYGRFIQKMGENAFISCTVTLPSGREAIL